MPLSDDLNAVTDNRLKTYNGTTYYYYDNFGNLIHREMADGEVQNYFYDLHDQLVKAEIFKKDGTKETWAYSYDALGRRIGKGRLKNKEVSETSFPHDLGGNGLEEETRFVWDGSHLLQEQNSDGSYTYIYTDPESYEPLAQVHNWTNEEGESRQQTHYFHCDQIGIPREMTDKDGNLLWFGNYTGWGRLKEETKVADTAYQPFRLQNQYADRETGLHYNFFRYYDPQLGRFVSQDPIGLAGGLNAYRFAPNSQEWVDPLGLEVDAVFNKRTGLLTIVDRETKQVITGKFHSGNGTPDPKQPGASIPSGQYNILEHGQNPDFFRLEPIDKNYGDDTHEATGRNLFRLHKPGGSIGCVAAKDENNWKQVNAFIRSTKTSTSNVQSKSLLNPFKWIFGEDLVKYGTLTVIE